MDNNEKKEWQREGRREKARKRDREKDRDKAADLKGRNRIESRKRKRKGDSCERKGCTRKGGTREQRLKVRNKSEPMGERGRERMRRVLRYWILSFAE